MSDTFFCWTCPQKGRPCSKQTFRKENWATCEAASKGLGFPVFATEGECQKYCDPGGKKPVDIVPVCWNCGGPKDPYTCQSFLGDPIQGCPKEKGVFRRKEDCEAFCGPFQPIGPPPIQPITPPIQPVTPFIDYRMWWYVLITVIVLVVLAIIVGVAFYFG